MIDILVKLKPFFLDNYERIHVREYARRAKVSPPTASKILLELEKENLVKKEIDKFSINFVANIENRQFIELSRIFFQSELQTLTDYLKENLLSPVIVLFGSFSKAEINKNSDIDIAVFSVSDKKPSIQKFEEKLKRKIQIFYFKDEKDVKNKELLNNIHNGYVLWGSY